MRIDPIYSLFKIIYTKLAAHLVKLLFVFLYWTILFALCMLTLILKFTTKIFVNVAPNTINSLQMNMISGIKKNQCTAYAIVVSVFWNSGNKPPETRNSFSFYFYWIEDLPWLSKKKDTKIIYDAQKKKKQDKIKIKNKNLFNHCRFDYTCSL